MTWTRIMIGNKPAYSGRANHDRYLVEHVSGMYQMNINGVTDGHRYPDAETARRAAEVHAERGK